MPAQLGSEMRHSTAGRQTKALLQWVHEAAARPSAGTRTTAAAAGSIGSPSPISHYQSRARQNGCASELTSTSIVTCTVWITVVAHVQLVNVARLQTHGHTIEPQVEG